MAVIPNEGELELLDKALKDALSTDESYSLRLFRNDYTPDEDATGSSFTVANFSGYSNKTLTRAGWGSATTVNSKASSTYSVAQTFTCNGGTSNSIYGWYLVASTSGKVLAAERFAGVQTMANGTSLTITPTITLNSEA